MARHGQHRDSEEQGRRNDQGGRGESERYEGGQQGWSTGQYDRNRESRSGRESGQGWQQNSGYEERGRFGTGAGDHESMEDFSRRHGGPRDRGQASGSGGGPEQELGQGSYRGNRRSWEGEERGAYMDRQRDYRQGEFGGDPYRERGFGGASEQGRYGQGRDGWEQGRHGQGGEQGRYGQGGMGQGWGPGGSEQGGGEGEFGGFGRGSGAYRGYEQGGMGQYGGGQRSGGQSYAGQQSRFGQSGSGAYGEMGRGRFTGRGPKGYRRSDDRIKEDVCEQLTLHPDIDASEVEIKVQSGELTLTGTVDDRQTKRMIEDLAEGVSGVKEVNNQLRVKQRESTGGVSNGAGTADTQGSRSRT